MLIDFPFRGFDVIAKSHHGTRCPLLLPLLPRNGEDPFIEGQLPPPIEVMLKTGTVSCSDPDWPWKWRLVTGSSWPGQ